MLLFHVPLCFYAEILISLGLKLATALEEATTGSIIPTAYTHTHFLDSVIIVVSDASIA